MGSSPTRAFTKLQFFSNLLNRFRGLFRALQARLLQHRERLVPEVRSIKELFITTDLVLLPHIIFLVRLKRAFLA